MKERNNNYDILRIVACIMIVCMHSPMPSENANGIFLSSVSYFTEPGLCMFFVLSGALLLPFGGKNKTHETSCDDNGTFTFLKKRLGKVIAPTLVFTALYIALDYMKGTNIDWWKRIFSIPFSNQGHGILWFMYTLIGLYLLSPVLSKWLEYVSKRELEFYLGLWAITLCYPILSMYLETNASETGMLFYFQGYTGYFVLGHYLRKYPESFSFKIIAIPALISVLVPVLCKILHIEVDFYSVFYYLSIFVTILTIFMYKIFTFKKITLVKGSKIERLVTTTSGLTFGIYLIHIAIMRNWLWKQEWIAGISNYYLQWMVIVLFTFFLSWIICYVISLLPFGTYIIGYQHRRK